MPTISIRNIDMGKFLSSGILVNASKSTKRRSKCYIITNLDPDIVNVDVAALVKKATGTFNKNHRVILCLTGTITKIRNIKNTGGKVYLKVKRNFSLPSDLKIQGQKFICLVGSRGSNELYGSDGNDWFSGGDGKDVLEGYGGNNYIYGGAGDDWLSGGNDDDKLFGGANDDTLLGYGGNDVLKGNTGKDWLLGAIGKDKLYGGFGNDKLDGGTGDDELYGGPGNNMLYFDTCNSTGHDLVQLDRSAGIDRIYLGENKKFITKWNSQKQEVQFYLFTRGSNKSAFTYDGNSITVKGFSKARKLLVRNYGTSKDELLMDYEITYKVEVKGQKETHSFDTLLFRGTREIFLPANCEFVSLRRPKGHALDGAVQKTFTDKTGKFNALFAVK